MKIFQETAAVVNAALRATRGCALVAGALTVSACGEAEPGEEGQLAAQQQGLGEATCATIPADLVQVGGFPVGTFGGPGASPGFSSPTRYSRSQCSKGYIIDLVSVRHNNNPVIFQWDGIAPDNEQACASAVIWVQEYHMESGSFVSTGPKEEFRGFWEPGVERDQFLGGDCDIPWLNFAPHQSPSASWRYAVSARSGGAAGPTVSFRVFENVEG